MSTYQTDEEQVEAIKTWWKENGRSVIGGIVLGFAIIGGWQGWQGYQRNQGEAASSYFDAMRQSLRSDQFDQAIEHGKRLVGEYGKTTYASFAGLELAKLSYQRGEKAAARDHLSWVAESAPEPVLRDLARLRLGQLLLDMGEHESLQGLLDGSYSTAFAGEFAALRGDLESALGNLDGAREAYQEALVKGVDDESLLRMKLVDVGDQRSES